MNEYDENTPDRPDTSEADETVAPETVAPENDATDSARLVPVTEAIRYRKRAQAAEQKVADLTEQISETQRELAGTRKRLSEIETRSQIDQMLRDAGAIDLEAARVLTMAALDESNEPDADRNPAPVIEALRAKRPYLFRTVPDDHVNPTAKAAAVRVNRGAPARRAEAAAAEARRTGRRDDLTRYLQVRRATRSAS